MKVPLKNFQKKAVRRLIKEVDAAYENWREDSDRSAVLLVAPTGSGKTVMATEVIEGLLDGSNEGTERPTLRILWLTDSPSLNRQSADKMDRYGEVLKRGKNLIVVDDGYDEEVLGAGTVTFAHIQQLTSSASSWWPNEAKGKTHALWHTIGKTVRDYGSDLLLVIDEAHKGIGRNSSEGDRATIIRTCLEGGANLYDNALHPAVPVALVMTATPQKFTEAMVASERLRPEVKVNVGDVQDEGLLKPRIRVEFAEENQKAHHTLLESGTEDLFRSQQWWKEAEDAGFPHVMPALVVQVENSISRAELGERMKTISDKWAELTGSTMPEIAFAHAFGDDGNLAVGNGMSLLKVPAEQIEADIWIRVIFFKEALTTGWDCPRAEVMVSLRPATDSTKIAQLVGRMIRTPGATHSPDPRLESVMLYLPYYAASEVRKVVNEIAKDTDGASVIELDSQATVRNPTIRDEVFNKIDGLPKYLKPKQDYPDNVERAADLAERLLDRGVVEVKEDGETPEDVLRGLLVSVMRQLDNSNRNQVDKRVKDLLEIDTYRQYFKYAGSKETLDDEGKSQSKRVHFRDLDGYFEDAKRRLPGGTGSWYYEALITSGVAGKRAKMRVAAVAEIADVRTSLGEAAASQIEAQQKEYEDRVETLGLGEIFKAIWYPATKPVDSTLVLTNPIRVSTQKAKRKGNGVEYVNLPLLEGHVFAFEQNDKWFYPGTDNAWEAAAISLELEPSRKVVGWFRNPSSGRSALSIPYYSNGRLALLHPDFIFVRDIDGALVVDIVDPHLDHGDSRDKWRGLAWYAAQHRDKVRRAIAVMRIGETDWGIDVAKEEVRGALANTDETLESIFQRLGSKRVFG